MKHFFVFAIPIFWSINTVVSFNHPGDEYGLYFIGAIAGSWLYIFFDLPVGHPSKAVPLVLVTGAALLAGAGYLLDRLGVGKVRFGVLLVVCSVGLVAVFLQTYPTLHDAMQKNGSLTAYVSSAASMGLYFSIFFTTLLAGVRRWVDRTSDNEAEG